MRYEIMRIWITKYALTDGILEQEGEKLDDSTVRVGLLYLHREGVDWHTSRESAIARAEVMRKKKIESLRKQIAKLEVLKFDF